MIIVCLYLPPRLLYLPFPPPFLRFFGGGLLSSCTALNTRRVYLRVRRSAINSPAIVSRRSARVMSCFVLSNAPEIIVPNWNRDGKRLLSLAL